MNADRRTYPRKTPGCGPPRPPPAAPPPGPARPCRPRHPIGPAPLSPPPAPAGPAAAASLHGRARPAQVRPRHRRHAASPGCTGNGTAARARRHRRRRRSRRRRFRCPVLSRRGPYKSVGCVTCNPHFGARSLNAQINSAGILLFPASAIRLPRSQTPPSRFVPRPDASLRRLPFGSNRPKRAGRINIPR